MATIYKEFFVDAPPEFVWEAIKDVGAVHTRLARGFVTDTSIAEGVRTVTFANGSVVREQIVTISDELRRLAYASQGGNASHHNASLQVFDDSTGRSRVLWVTDLLPENSHALIAQMVELGSSAIQQTIEESFQEQQKQFEHWVSSRLR
jgi:carbon monoxide dehydrogenase subunit G